MPYETSRIRRVGRVFAKQKAAAAVCIILIVMLFSRTSFYTVYNWLDLLKSAAVLEIIAFGVTMTIVSGGFDLSVGGIMCLAGIITIRLMERVPVGAAILIAILVGIMVGIVNGLLVVQQKTEPFIITLGMGILLKGISQQLTDAHPIAAKNLHFGDLANGKPIAGIPNLVLYFLIIMIVMHVILSRTQFGRNCYAAGGDYLVAKYAGIDVIRTKWITYVISGGLAALGGVLLSSKLNAGSSLYGETTSLTVSCGAVVGGTSFSGGVGGILHTMIGVFVVELLENAMNMFGVDAYTQQICKGVVIVAVIWLDCFGRKRKREIV